ncbi:MAG: hypothetical protein DI535_24870 [Citrobacter freundii]|nr:MAG: hypothetical protein DI535_24870 [Citrobacter freundii]
MKFAGLLFLSFLFIPSFLLSQTNSQTETPFQLLPSGHILVKASIEGIEGSFIFDTGAGLTAFTKAFFQKLTHTEKQDGGYTGFRATGERVDLDLYKVKDFRMGPFKKAVDEISYLDADLGGIDGIISLKSIDPNPFTIDFEKKVIRLESANSLNGISKKAKAIPVQLEDSRGKALTIFAFFKVNDQLTLQFSLDSGAGKDIYRINAKYLQVLGVNTADTALIKRYEKKSEIDTSHISYIYVTKLAKLNTAANPSINVNNIPVQFLEGLIYDGIVWINWLGSQVTFDLQHQRLLVIR